MILKALKYSRYLGEPQAWCIEGNNDDYANFSNINLLVGKNAAGKSRTLSVIKEIASLLSSKINLEGTAYSSQHFDLIFERKNESADGVIGQKLHYILTLSGRKVVEEQLHFDDKLCFSRLNGKVEYGNYDLSQDIKEKLNQLSQTQLGIISEEASGEPHFPIFVRWGEALQNYLFADQFEKRALVEDLAVMEDIGNNKELTGALLFTFYIGKQLYGDEFVAEVTTCMHELGYSQITNIDILKTPRGYCIGVEEDSTYVVSQRAMSQGMFRALSLFVFIVYARKKNLSACFLIDDIGEGVDYERSKKLVDLIIKKLQGSSIQCFMSTNDRYVMNDIPLRFWTVIDRMSKKSVIYDIGNSPEVFADFKFTGLNNFEFLTTDFYKDGFGEDNEDEDEE